MKIATYDGNLYHSYLESLNEEAALYSCGDMFHPLFTYDDVASLAIKVADVMVEAVEKYADKKLCVALVGEHGVLIQDNIQDTSESCLSKSIKIYKEDL